MNGYILDVRTNKDLGSEEFIRKILIDWRGGFDPRMRVEFFDLAEPVRRSFAVEGVESAIEEWINSGMSLYLRRQTKPKFQVVIDWHRDRGLDDRQFPWSCTVWLAGNAGDSYARALFRFLIDHFEPAFGHCSTEAEDRAKHFITLEDLSGRNEQYLGLEIGETLPGVYWLTYFGAWAIRKIGARRFHSIPGAVAERVQEGYLVQAFTTAKQAGTLPVQEAEDMIINQLGRNHFFDKNLVDVESLKTDPETAAVVQAKIEALKKSKKSQKGLARTTRV